MSSEAAGANRFYSGSGKYLSPLERKRLRAIQNELPQAEQLEPSRRVTRARTPKPQPSAEKASKASKKRKRSAASTPSGVTSARPKKRTRVPKTPASEKKASKTLAIPWSDGEANPPPPSDENSGSAPHTTTKTRKFFSSGLRFLSDGGGTSAAATTVSWNKKNSRCSLSLRSPR